MAEEGASSLYRLPVRGKQPAQFTNSGKYFLVPIGALTVVSTLLHLDDLAILLEDPISEPRQHRPCQVEHARDFCLCVASSRLYPVNGRHA